MRIYSHTSMKFIQSIKSMAREILSTEAGLELRTTRLLYNGYLYPVKFIVFEGRALGRFNSSFYEIGLNKNLLYSAKKDVIRNILRHELAHLLCFLRYGQSVQDHGSEYRALCKDLNWGPEVYLAKMDLEIENQSEGNLESERIIAKVKKLLSLATSSNAHEAKLATLKANELMIKHNIELAGNNDHAEIETYVHEVLSFKRATPKYKAISDILSSFFVYPVMNYGKKTISLEVTGSKTNVIIAEYIARYLDRYLEQLWQESGLKGISQKKSFMLGISQGHKSKIQHEQSRFDQTHKKALIKVGQDLNQRVRLAYGRLSGSRELTKLDGHAHDKGLKSGKNLNLKSAIGSTTQRFLINE